MKFITAFLVMFVCVFTLNAQTESTDSNSVYEYHSGYYVKLFDCDTFIVVENISTASDGVSYQFELLGVKYKLNNPKPTYMGRLMTYPEENIPHSAFTLPQEYLNILKRSSKE